MKKFLTTVVLTLGVVTSVASATIEVYQIAKDGSFQVTFKNGYNVCYDTEINDLAIFK